MDYFCSIVEGLNVHIVRTGMSEASVRTIRRLLYEVLRPIVKYIVYSVYITIRRTAMTEGKKYLEIQP